MFFLIVRAAPRRLLRPGFCLFWPVSLLCQSGPPVRSEGYGERMAHSAAPPAHSALIDVNRATAQELMTVSGLTEVWAKRIVRYRPYRTKRDLLDHGIVPPAVYERIEGSIIAHRAPQ
jgi:hypothetical protein